MNTTSTIIALAMLMSGDGGEEPDFVDSDNDGVQDVDDLCPGSDDTVDLDANDTPDCSETFVSNLMFDDAQSISAVTIHPNSNASWASTHDGNGWSGSGALWITSSIPQIGSMMSVCVDVPLYYDYLGVWYHARTAWTSNVAASIHYHQYNMKGCTGPSTTTIVHPGNIGPATAVPWPVVDDELTLAGATRSVLIDFAVFTDQPWELDNILLLPRIGSEDDDGPPPQN